MKYSIFAVVTDDPDSADYLPADAGRSQVEAFMSSHDEAFITGETNDYDQSVLVNGTYEDWTSDDLAKRYDPARSYLLVETSIYNKNPETYDTLRKDDPRVKWFKVIQPGDKSPFILENIYGNATVKLTKSAVEKADDPKSDIVNNKVDSLLSDSRDLAFTIAPVVSGKNQMLSSFVLEENGITPTPAVDGFQYKFTGIKVGQPSHDVSIFNKAPSDAPIKAIVEFYGADDSTTPLGTKVVTDFGTAVTEIPDGTTRFTITYTSENVVNWTEGIFDDTYCLGEQFTVQPTKVYVKAVKQPNGKPGQGVDPITELRNDAKVTLEYPKWNATGGKDEPVKVDPTAYATVLVNPIKIPMVEITKRVDKQAVSFGDADSVLLTYTLTVSNKSGSSTNFIDPVVLDILPTAGSYKAGSAQFVITEPAGAVEKLKLDVQTMPGAASVVSSGGGTVSEPENAVIFYLTDAEDSPCRGLKPGTTVQITYQAEIRSTASSPRSSASTALSSS